MNSRGMAWRACGRHREKEKLVQNSGTGTSMKKTIRRGEIDLTGTGL